MSWCRSIGSCGVHSPAATRTSLAVPSTRLYQKLGPLGLYNNPGLKALKPSHILTNREHILKLKTKIIDSLNCAFPAMRAPTLDRLANLIISVGRDDEERLSIASKIPAQRFGTFRLDAQTHKWIIIDPDFQTRQGYCG